ncbi:hypothetical protein FA95DRAFT_1610512 [Auriscalpium vulgare]|uniref:Uncharacterized protein n=1 Tax=Auriscalpium vulgare TaxID=40419 RepID=A0ACB8RDH5_9AGAM|nr:hypothetical protein FA95DRAFT_1610512 [Auriscalpium vulgare]
MAQALPPPNWDEVSQPSNTLSTNVAPVPNTAPIVQGQVLADLQASITALQGLPDAMKQFAAELTTLEAQFTTLNEKVTTLTENVNANTASLLALSNTVTENVNTVKAIAWKYEWKLQISARATDVWDRAVILLKSPRILTSPPSGRLGPFILSHAMLSSQ